MALSIGTRFGVYEVTGRLGEGGMGQVFRARDRKLNRDVALKVLPDSFAHDADRVARFVREAQTLASLNHPRIAAIYGLEESDGLAALVMELVEGEDLSQRIARVPMPLDDALLIAKQIAEALEAAHEQGIVHRDLKPANIKVRADGAVKVLDFGLAKAMDPTQSNRDGMSASPTLTSPAMTQAGIILGTAPYMSPEQAKGRPVDRRTDIWAFGAVFYEMLTGRRAFDGDGVTEVIANILKQQPDWTALPDATPAPVRRLLRRCLEKDRTQRLPDAAAARLEIEDALSSTPTLEDETRIPALQPKARLAALPWVVAMAALVVSGVAGWTAWGRAPQAETESLYASVTLPDGFVLGENDSDTVIGLIRTPFVFTPDGKAVVFVAARGGKSQLFVRPLDRPDSRLISGTDGGQTPFLSPAGTWVGFWATGELRKVPLEGGAPTSIAVLPTAPNGATWGSDDVIVFGDQDSGRVMRVSPAGGSPTPVSSEPGTYRRHVMPVLLSDASRLLYSDVSTNDASDSRLMVQSLTGGPATVLVDRATDGRLVSPTRLVFMRLGTLMTVGFDTSRASVLGEAVAVLPQVAYSALRGATAAEHPGVGIYAVSTQGALAVVRGPVMGPHPGTLVWATPSGLTSADPASGSPVGRRIMTRITPDGTRAVVTVQTPMRRELWFLDWVRNAWTPCPDCLSDRGFAEWSPDGRRLLLSRGDTLVAHSIDGSSDDVVIVKEENRRLVPGPWLRDGRIIYQSRTSADLTRAEIKVYEPASSTTKVIVAAGVASEPAVSPDGRWLAYGSTVEGQRENVFVQAFPGPGKRMQVSAGGGTNPAWSPDGRTLYYLSNFAGNALFAADLTATGDDTVVGASRELFRSPPQNCSGVRCYDVALPGPRWLFREPVAQASGMTHFDLILNWADNLPTSR